VVQMSAVADRGYNPGGRGMKTASRAAISIVL
jgi:hypothetical protein